MARIINYLIVSVMLGVLLVGLSGCGGQTSNLEWETAFAGGQNGLVIDFVQGMPPDAVYDSGQYPFSIAVRVTNAGESNVGLLDPYFTNPNDMYPDIFGELRIVGLLPLSWGNPPPMIRTNFAAQQFGLRGVRKHMDGSIIEGDTRDITLTGFNYQEDLVGNTMIPVRAELCYDYTTQAVGQVCISESVLQNQDALCYVNQDIVPQNSGAPVQVVSMRQNSMGPSTISLNFMVDHVGSGQVFARDNPSLFPDYQFVSPLGNQLLSCDTNPAAQRNRDKVHVKVYFRNQNLDDSLIACSNFNGFNQGVISLMQGNSVPIMCRVTVPSGMGAGEFSQALNIELKYRYLETIQKDIVIQDLTMV